MILISMLHEMFLFFKVSAKFLDLWIEKNAFYFVSTDQTVIDRNWQNKYFKNVKFCHSFQCVEGSNPWNA